MIIENSEEIKSEEVVETQAPTINPEILENQSLSPFMPKAQEFPAFGLGKKRIKSFSPMPTDAANTELSFMASRSLPAPPWEIKQHLEKGDKSPLHEAQAIQTEEAQVEAMANTERRIQDTPQPQDVLTLLSELEQKLKRTPTLMEQRAAYNEYLSAFERPEGVSTEGVELSPILKHTVQNNLLSMEAAKRQQEYERSVDYIKKWTQDFPELLSPTAGLSQEYFKNYVTNIYGSLDKLGELPPERQIEFINTLIDQAIEQETFLFNNNNSFMAEAQIETIYKALSQGAALQARGATEAEVRSIIDSVFESTLYVSEIPAIARGIKGIAQFLMRRIHPASTLKEVAEEQERLIQNLYGEEAVRRLDPNRAQYIAEESVKAPSLVRTVGDKRERLQKIADQKGTTKERKALEQEKKDLGARTSELKGMNVNQEARAIAKDKKIKFKEARKEVEEARNAELRTIESRQKTNQELINEFDRRAKAESELSRIDTFLRDGRLTEADLIEETDEFAVLQTQKRTIKPVIYRENYNAFDTQFKFNPPDQVKAENTGKGGLQGIKDITGMAAKDVAERAIMTPTPEATTGFRNVGDRSMILDAQLVDASKDEIGAVLGRELEGPMGTSLMPIYSETKMVENAIEESYGTFTFRLADGQKPFETAQDAEESIKAAATGYDYRISKADEGYYVDVDVDHYLNPYSDSAALVIKEPTPSAFASLALNNARLVEEDLIRGLFAMKNVNRSTVHKLEEKAKEAVGRLSPDENALLSTLLKRGDNNEREWTNTQSIFKEEGLTVPDNVFESYRDIREIYDAIFRIRESNYYNKLRRANMKYIKMGDKKELGTPIQTKNMEAEEALDVRTGEVVKKEDIETGIVVKLGIPREVAEGRYLSHVVVNQGDISSLVRGFTLTRRTGHVDRMYRDAGWTVSIRKAKNIDGKDVLKSKVTHIVQTEAQADKIAAKLKEEGQDVLRPQRSRENDELEDIFSDSESIQFGYGASHMKKRNEIAKGPDGISEAGTYDVFESLYRSINNTQNALDYNAFQSAKVKYIKGFQEYFQKGLATEFDPDFNRMLKDEARRTIPKDTLREMKNHHAYLKSLLQNQRSSIYKGFDAVFQPLTGMFNKTADSQQAAVLAQKAATEMYIVWNGIYQMNQNALPMMWTISTGGKGGVQAVRQLVSLRAAFKGNMKPLINSLDGNEELAKKLVGELKNNGLVDAVGRMDDFLDLARSEHAGVALNRGVKWAGQKVKQGLYDVPREGLVRAQESTIILNNVFAYLTEFNNYVAKSGGKFDAKAAAEVSFQAQKRTQTQNSLDRFSWQNNSNPLSLFTQFFQAIYKGTLDWVIEPQWEAMRSVINPIIKPIFKKEMKHLGKNVGRISDSTGKAWMAALTTWVMFGPEGAMGRKMGTMMEDYVRQQYQTPEDVPVVVDKLLDGMLSTVVNDFIFEGTGAEFDVTATMSPAAMVDIATGIASDMSLTPVSVFAVGSLIGSVYNTLAVGASTALTDELDVVDWAGVAATEMLTNLKIVDSTHKAYIAYWSGRNASSRTLSSELPIDTVEAVGKILGLEAEMTSDYFFRQDFFSKVLDTGEKFVQANIDAGLRSYAMEAAAIKTKLTLQAKAEGTEVDPMEVAYALMDARKKWIASTKSITADHNWGDIERAFRERSIKFNPASPEIFLKPYLEDSHAGNRALYIRSIEQRAPEKYQEVFGNIREGYEITEGTDNNNG